MKPPRPGNTTRHVNPIVIMLGILLLATALTYFVDSGEYARDGRLVIPDSYRPLDKDRSPAGLFALAGAEPGEARPVSLLGTLLAIPAGLDRMAGLIFMVLIIGGMFGVITHTGAIDAGLEKLLSSARGNVHVLIPVLMLVFAAGSSFLGLASEYLLIIPLMVIMAGRLGLSRVVGLAIVTVAVKAGYLSSVTNPIPLSIAQPLIGLPVFSGAGVRFAFFLVFTVAGIAYVLYRIRAEGGVHEAASIDIDHGKLSALHLRVLVTLTVGVAFLVYASNRWHWEHGQLSAYYIFLGILVAAVGGLGASEAAEAFVGGMKKILMASMLIGVASAVAIVLEQGRILDSIVHGLTGLIGGDNAFLAAIGMFCSQLLLDFLIPSTSGQATVSMPILGPLGQLTGVPPQTTVLTFLFGNGITNMLTPTSGTLLAYLATAQVGWVEWARFIFRLWLIYIAIAVVLLGIAIAIGY